MSQAWLGVRFGNLWPIIIGIIFNVVFGSTLALGTHPILFGAGYFGWKMACYFLVLYMLGCLAEMDDRGRWAVAADAVWQPGAAPGAAVGGIPAETCGCRSCAGCEFRLPPYSDTQPGQD